MKLFFQVVLFSFFLTASLGAEEQKSGTEHSQVNSQSASATSPQSPTNPQTTPGSTVQNSAEAEMRKKVEAEIQKRVKELIELINQEPNLMMVNPKAVVVKEPDWKPYTPDGKYNQDFKVVPDDSAPEISQAVNVEQNRQKWAEELVMIGLPAVPELVKAVLDPGKKYRHFYVSALGQIKDVKACPAILKYYQEGIDQEKLAKSLEQVGASSEAQNLRQESALKKNTAIEALKSISGQNFGDDYAKWEQWWKETEKKIGSVELPKLYEIKGVKEDQPTKFAPATVTPASGSTAK